MKEQKNAPKLTIKNRPGMEDRITTGANTKVS